MCLPHTMGKSQHKDKIKRVEFNIAKQTPKIPTYTIKQQK